MAYTIRPAEPADVAALVPLFSAYLDALSGMGLRYAPRHEGVPELLESRVKSRRALLAVAEEDGVLLGFVCAGTRRIGGEYLAEGQGVVGYVDDIYVRPGSRGRGIASALADRAEAWMAESGVGAVELHVLLDNPGAAAFWRSRGMEPMSALCHKRLPSSNE